MKRIVIASVLKPVDDVRMYEKIAKTLSSEFEVHVIGYPIVSPSFTSGVRQHLLFATAYKRLSIQRFAAPWKFFRKVRKLKPEHLVICTHELIIAALLLKLFMGYKVVYDVQENYYRNILYTPAFPPVLRPFVATWVRLKEWVSAPFIDHFILAERAYQFELPFVKNKFTIIENKFKGSPRVPKVLFQRDRVRLMFSGTLAESTGVYVAIALASKLWQQDPNITLVIVGHCSLSSDYHKIKNLMADKPFIHFIGGDTIVPHASIIDQINQSDFGIIAYPPNKATETSVPTKLYEYLANALPILLIENRAWLQLCAPYEAALPFNLNRLEAGVLLQKMKNNRFYSSKPADVLWNSEETRLITLFSERHLK